MGAAMSASPPLPPDHTERHALAAEVHARPSETLTTPERATYVAVLVGAEARDAERTHLIALCAGAGVAPPSADATHFSAQVGAVRLKWERHTEFSSYTMFAPGRSRPPFSETAAALLPAGWLARIPGQTIVAAHAELIRSELDPPDAAFLAAHFDGNVVVGAEIGDGAGYAFTDFQTHADGYARFLLLDRSLSPRQAGRMLQRLCEIDAYRMMALLALPVARREAPHLASIERSLTTLTDQMTRETGADESLLAAVTGMAAEVERALSATQFRFGASRAYYDLVRSRIAELRERRIPGIQTIDEFMTRRLTPAMATCVSVSQRLRDLSERVSRASGLLSTRVEIAREKQNQTLLASMDRRARLQLRLQQTVEGLSVAAVTYYAVGLIGYAAKGLKASGVPVDPEVAMAVAIPVIAVLVFIAVRRARHKLTSPDLEKMR
jgi:uncharacterized membrane-anchored protein